MSYCSSQRWKRCCWTREYAYRQARGSGQPCGAIPMWIPRPRSAGKAESRTKGKDASNRNARDGRDGSEARGMRTNSEVVTRTSQHESSATIRPMLPNNGAMSAFVGAFDVASKLTGKVYQCRFSHMWNGI